MPLLTRPEGVDTADLALSRRGVSLAIFAGFAAAASDARAEPVHTDGAGLRTQMVQYLSQGFQLPAYLARPDRPGRFPAVIVASEIFGLHEYIRDVCRRLAKLGYVAAAPAFFVRVADPAPLADIGQVMKIVARAPDPQVMGDVGATLAFLRRQRFVDADRIAITGFCWGGGVVWLACETFASLKAGVAWYGRMAPPPGAAATADRLWPVDRVSQLHAPVLGLYGAKDPLADTVPAMRAALAAAGHSDSKIILYADAGHGFHADYRASYNAADAADGWRRMLAFFAAHGGAPGPMPRP